MHFGKCRIKPSKKSASRDLFQDVSVLLVFDIPNTSPFFSSQIKKTADVEAPFDAPESFQSCLHV